MSLPVHLCWGAAPTLCRGSLAPPIGMDTAGHSGAAGAAEWRPASGCPDCRAGGPQFGAVSMTCMKGQAGALGAVFQHLPVWGIYPPRPPILVHTPGVSQERLSANHHAPLSLHASQMSPLSSLGW